MEYSIIGNGVQYLQVKLQRGEPFFAEKGALIYIEDGIHKDAITSGSGLGKMLGAKLSGESIFMVKIVNISDSEKTAAIGCNYGLHQLELNGESIICLRGAYVASSTKMDITTKLSITGMTGGMGLMLQKITGKGLLFLDTIGDPISIVLPPGKTIELDENHIIALHNIKENQISSKWSVSNVLGGEGLSMLRVTGPGKVYLSPIALRRHAQGEGLLSRVL